MIGDGPGRVAPVLVVAGGAVGSMLRRVVGRAAGLRVVGHTDPDRVVDVVGAATAVGAEVVVTDADPGADTATWSRVLGCGVGVVGVLGTPSRRRVLAWLRVGARGVVSARTPAWVEPVITATAAGQVLVCPTSSAAVVDDASWIVPTPDRDSTDGVGEEAAPSLVVTPGGVVLTRQQAAVLRVLAAGTTAAEGAVALGMSAATFRTHVEAVLRRLGVHDRAAAVAWAYRSRFVTPPG